jgi:hypothetical protein
MRKFSIIICLISLASLGSTGCKMCSNEHLYDYAGVGGKWPRSNPACGRVGSIFSDAGAMSSTSAVPMENIPESETYYGDDWGLLDSRMPAGEFPMLEAVESSESEELIIDPDSENAIIIGS